MRYIFLLVGFLGLTFFQVPLGAQETAAPPVAGQQAPETAPKPSAEERREARREAVEARLRALMNSFGLDDKVKQDALISYLAEDEAGKATVREAAKRLMTGVRRGTDPEGMRELISHYKTAMDSDKARRVAAQTTLDAKIGWSLDPRVEGVLWLFGVLGEGEPAVSSNGLGPRGAFSLRNETSPRRSGGLNGIVEAKGEDWVEVRENEKISQRYELPIAADAPAVHNAVRSAIAAAKVGDRVQLEWMWNGRMRLIKLEIIPAAGYPTEVVPAPQNK